LPCGKDSLVLDVDAIDNTDNGGIDGQFFCLRGHAGARPLDDEHHFALAGPDRIDHHEGPARGDQPVALGRVHPQRLDSQQLVPGHRGDLLGRDHAAGDLGQEHGSHPPHAGSSTPLTCRATISSSLVAMIHTCTPLPRASMRASALAWALTLGSRAMPNQSRLAQTAARMAGEFSPMPPVKTMASAPPSWSR